MKKYIIKKKNNIKKSIQIPTKLKESTIKTPPQKTSSIRIRVKRKKKTSHILLKKKKKKLIYYFKKRNFKKFMKWKVRRHKRKILVYRLKRKLIRFRKYLYYKYFSFQKQYILRLCFTRTNLFFVCTNFWGDVIFWFTSKQLGFRRYQLKSPYTIDAFNTLLVYYLKFHKILNFNIFFLGYNRHKKRFIQDLFELRFVITGITRYIPVTFNGCKRKHKRRK